jgi:DNA repair photolyase
VELLAESGHAFTITTKSPLIERDLDLLAPLGQRGQVSVNVSLISLDHTLLHRLEPGTSPPQRRLEIVRAVKAAGVPVGVFAAPIIPGLCDGEDQLRALFDAVQAAGTDWGMTSTTRLSPAIRHYFITEVGRFDPAAAAHIRSLYGPAQYVDTGYRRELERLVRRLAGERGLSQTPPSLHACVAARPQMEFAFE